MSPSPRPGRATRSLLAAALVVLAATAWTAPARALTTYTLPGGPFAGRSLYVAPNTSAALAAATATDPTRKQLLTHLAAIPQATWLVGGTPTSAASTVSSAVAAAAHTAQVTEFVIYDIPHRDCTGGQSAGGASTPTAYQSYVKAIATALSGAHAIVVLEPDALAGLDCLNATDQVARLALLKWATNTLTAKTGVLVYLDAGNNGWQTASTMAARLTKAGITAAHGFALNVANFDTTTSEIRYGTKISSLVGWKRFIIDTSRNGTTPRVPDWCNPPGAALGSLPGTPTSYPGVDALLWLKHPGESDGACGTSTTPAGQFDVNLAISLALRADWW